MASPYRPYTPTKRTNTNNTPFRSGFQPKGVYRDRTDQLVAARRTRQEAKRLEEKLLAISSDLLAARPGSLRAHEQAIVRWQDDTSAGDCTLCHTPFGLRIRKHHCRLCGQLVCFKPHSAGPRRCSSPPSHY
ncbi:hypothetical protein PtB15_11B443 [Puccinia triticina]|nr:hypothetical protein PtB15_11B443 [Puccinia triticina]